MATKTAPTYTFDEAMDIFSRSTAVLNGLLEQRRTLAWYNDELWEMYSRDFDRVMKARRAASSHPGYWTNWDNATGSFAKAVAKVEKRSRKIAKKRGIKF